MMCSKVRQREDDTRSAKMMLKFRDDKIHRMEVLVNSKLPAQSYLLEENKTLSQEVELLRERVDKNPEVTRFALENIRLSSQLKRYALIIILHFKGMILLCTQR
jgi:kinesin family member 15